jgi:hypothetical protein
MVAKSAGPTAKQFPEEQPEKVKSGFVSPVFKDFWNVPRSEDANSLKIVKETCRNHCGQRR